ncbi:hypothetical protein DdX_20329 [Ditylenchus destructor]|uniref:Uncharacterized protein n=1 Tax=Ditylenchus destructor TaxID=166010 RepID=A0AAD4MHD3_9BILA|nr:hypothetical protein DdX_20329 [Ditylenchus destructor]
MLGLVLGTRVLKLVKQELKLPISHSTIWTDSECVLHWNAFLAVKVEAVFILTGRDALVAHQAPSQILEDTKCICQIMQRWEHARIVLIQTPYVHSEAALWKGYFHDFVQTILNHATTPGAQTFLAASNMFRCLPSPVRKCACTPFCRRNPTKAGIIEMRDRVEGITGIHIPLKPDVPLPRASQDTPKDGNNDDRHDHGSRRSDRKEPSKNRRIVPIRQRRPFWQERHASWIPLDSSGHHNVDQRCRNRSRTKLRKETEPQN